MITRDSAQRFGTADAVSYITFFCAARARTTASAQNSSALAIMPLVPSCRNGTSPSPIGFGRIDVAGADEHRVQNAAERAAGDQPGAEQRARRRLPIPPPRPVLRLDDTRAPGRRRRSARSSRSAGTSRRRTTASGCRRARASTEMNTPTSTRPHGRFWLSSPLMIVAISVACGAGSAGEPMPNTLVQVERRHADDERRGDDADDRARSAGRAAWRRRCSRSSDPATCRRRWRPRCRRPRRRTIAIGRVDVAGPAERDEDQAGQDQRRDRHARDRVRRGADEAGDARRHGRRRRSRR